MLKLRDIKKTYVVDNQHFPALKNINLTFPDKGFVSILGPSGCGKTTLLNLIGGLDQYTAGDLIINNKSTKKFTDRDWDAYRNKRVGFVFQTYNLVPHLTVLGNVELSMTLTGMNKRERQKKATLALKRVGLKDAIKKKPNQLSGGQMQRVAIARSLVNNPEIVLADEPTGALDSVTSVQVMEILKEVAKDRLVIMVTHNVELAKKYSTRIIRLKDGRVISDSKPERGAMKDEKKELEQEKNKHTHMSFFTALASSAKSLLTKKGRTAMTAVAASFGIIGVALVLAMSNGFTGYVNRVEMATASTVPITIAPFVTTSIQEINLPEPWPGEEVIKPYDQDITQLVTIHHNNISNDYSDYCKAMLQAPHQYASSVLENHEYLDFNIFTERERSDRTKEIIKVNQFASAGAGTSILSGVTSLPATIFHELYGGKEYIDNMYDTIYGEYPKDTITWNEKEQCYEGEVCLACDRYNRIPTETLYDLGLSSTSTTTEGATISFSDIIGHEYKSFTPETVIKAVPLNDSGDPTKQNPLVKTVTSDQFVNFDKNDIYNLKAPAAEDTRTIKAYRNVAAKDVLGAYRYPDYLQSLYTNDATNHPVKLKITGIIRPKRTTLVNLIPGSVCYPTCLKEHYLKHIGEFEEYANIARNNYYIDPKLQTETVIEPTTGLEITRWQDFLSMYMQATLSGSTTKLYDAYLNNVTGGYFHFFNIFTDTDDVISSSSTTRFSNYYLRSNYRFSNAFKTPKFDYIDIEGYHVPINVQPDSIDDFSDVITYIAGYSPITSILVFPRTLSDKQNIFKYLDQWNEGKSEIDQIKYADIAGTLTDALGTMIDIISVVLIVFSSVSLLVSCVMTGVITYTSVLERTKEIGILRAIGARKKDVGRLFEAESVIIGGIAGLAGVLFTFIVEWPISLAINSAYPEQNIGMICNLSPWHALILVIISILLTFISGFIPARKASKKDPVVALRTE